MTETIQNPPASRTFCGWHVIALWLIAGVVLVASARMASVSRTQEARVLETAREMLGRPFAGWMIPHTNGEVRLHKPPLAYWLSAGAFKLLGTSTWAGRVPEAIAGWATLGLTFLIGRRLFDQTAALFGAAALMGCWLFFKNTLLAETDALGMAFVTAGLYAVLRAIETPRSFVWQHAIGLCIALAILAKGPPAAYVALFYIAVCAIRRDWLPIKRFFVSGAIVTLLVIALPWFIYVAQHVGSKQLIDDLKNSAEGGKGHAGWPHVYVPMFAKAALPWTAVWAVAAAAAVRHVWRRIRPWQGLDSISLLLLWGLIIALPLMGWGNKQEHYLLPLMPPVMILVGYGIAGAIDGRGRFHDLSRIVLAVTAGLLALVPVLPVLVALMARDPREVQQMDYLVCGLLVIVVTVAIFLVRRDGWRGGAWATIIVAVALMITLQYIGRVVEPFSTERLAGEMLRTDPDAHFVFRGEPSLSLCFMMGQTIPVLDDAAISGKANDPKLVCLERTDDEPKSTAPAGFVERGRIGRKGEWLRVFVPAS